MRKIDSEKVRETTLRYFGGDELATSVTLDKYLMKDSDGDFVEESPRDMHARLAREFLRSERSYANPMTAKTIVSLLSQIDDFVLVSLPEDASIESLVASSTGLGAVVPQGSPMSALGNRFRLQSASNCFVIDSPEDSFGGIFLTSQEEAEIMKRRGGVGFDASKIRPKGMPTANAAGTTDGIAVFLELWSEVCRKVAQGGRRGALMMTINCFDGSTLVLTEDGWQKIEDVVNNKYFGKAWTHEGWQDITAHQRFEDSEVYEIEAENGRTITVTADHKFVVKNVETGEEYLKAIKDVDASLEELVFYDIPLCGLIVTAHVYHPETCA